MNDVYGPFIERVAPLTYSEAIYWLGGARYVEQLVSRTMMKDEHERGWALTRARKHLDYACQKEARELGWVRYHMEEEQTTDDLYVRIRRTLYECPGFRELRLWRTPSDVYTLSIRPQGGPVVDLPLARLSYHGERARGVLYDGALHVVIR